MKIGQMMDSKYLKKEDVDPPKLLTIKAIAQGNVGKDDAPDFKWCMSFHELTKPMVLNSTNIQLAAAALGSDDTDNWIGKQVVLFNDPNVSFQGKLTGGVRIRAPRMRPAGATAQVAAQPPAAAQMATAEDFDDDIPF